MEKFWMNDPAILVKKFNLLPSLELSLNEKLNALTRIIFIITIIMLCFDFPYWYWFLIIGLLIIMAIKIICSKYCDNDRLRGNYNENFSIPPTYIDGSEPMTTISPIYSEEIQSPSPIYDTYDNASGPEGECGEIVEDRPIFGQYISSNRLFPYQQGELNNRPLNDSLLYMNNEWSRDQLQFRNDMTRTFINKLDRAYKLGCADSISPTNSY